MFNPRLWAVHRRRSKTASSSFALKSRIFSGRFGVFLRADLPGASPPTLTVRPAVGLVVNQLAVCLACHGSGQQPVFQSQASGHRSAP